MNFKPSPAAQQPSNSWQLNDNQHKHKFPHILSSDWDSGNLIIKAPHTLIPVLEDPEAPGRHTVDAPVGDPVLVADADTEPPVVGPHHPNDRPLGAHQVQLVSLTSIRGLHPSLGRAGA